MATSEEINAARIAAMEASSQARLARIRAQQAQVEADDLLSKADKAWGKFEELQKARDANR